jgi:pimeloyl-ACP methyl ester carboxylesterase
MRPIIYREPPPAPAPDFVGFPDLLAEWRLVRESLRLGLALPRFALAPRGDGEPVLLIPGFQAPEASMQPLRLLLRRKGYDARHWGQGINRGNVERYIEALLPLLDELSSEAGQPVTLVGWSLGGVIARELARERADQVRGVITYGSPVVGGPTYTVAARSYDEAERRRIRELTRERDQAQPITVPIAAIFSRGDTIVSWPACIDRVSPNVTHYEVTSTHFSMGIDPTVWEIVLERLRESGDS